VLPVVLLIGTGVYAAGICAVAFALLHLSKTVDRQLRAATIQQQLATFAPAAAAVQQDPRQLLVWYPIAQTSRRLFPDAFAQLDRAANGTFPFSKEQLRAAHARCSSEWLAWERAHDAEFSLKAAEVQNDMERAGQSPAHASPLLRTRLAAIEQEKLEKYQQRYEEYVKTAKALAAFAE
jgi:hypothetical protein